MNTKLCISISLCFVANFLCAQNISLLDSIILANKYEINQKDNQFSGSGMDYILDNCKNAQFVGIAENHNTKEIPIFTSYLFKQLHEYYLFNYMALEQDAVMMKLLSSKKNDVVEMAKKYPNGYTFISDQELDLIKDAINISNKKNAIWGCDQSFGASHSIAHILISLKDKSKSYDKIEQIYNQIFEKEKVRNLEVYRYMTDTLKKSDLLSIKKELVKSNIDSLNFYINSLIISDSIYSQIIKKKYFQSRSMRESYMRKRFISEYKNSLTMDSLPKVLLKFGHYHLMDGFNTGSHSTNIGDLVRNIAQYNNQQSLIINTQIFRIDNSDWDYLEESYPMFTKHSDVNSWTLFDLRPLQKYQANGLLKGQIKKDLINSWENLIYKFDMLLIIGNGGDGTWNTTGVKY